MTYILSITGSNAPVTSVYVYYLPVDARDVGIRLALANYGTVHEITHQHFAGFNKITRTRIVHMSLDQHIPFQCNIQGYPCRVWYSGQPLKCTICKGAHKAADCPEKNKCKGCHQAGHFACDWKNAWGTTPQTHNFLNPQNIPPYPSGGAPPSPTPPALLTQVPHSLPPNLLVLSLRLLLLIPGLAQLILFP